jgi:hypothetical protein
MARPVTERAAKVVGHVTGLFSGVDDVAAEVIGTSDLGERQLPSRELAEQLSVGLRFGGVALLGG